VKALRTHRTSRRAFLAGLGGACLLPAGCQAPEDTAGNAAEPSELWLSAHGADEASYALLVASAEGVVARIESGFRGHDVCLRPGHPDRVVLFGRRPGHEAIEVDLAERRVVRRVRVSEDRALQGHGFYTPDGAQLVTSEADVETGLGKLTVRDAETLELLSELDSHGVGPHEIALLPDQRTIVVANGGLFTRPESGDEVLNLDTMRSSLAYVDLASGALVHEEVHAEPKASIRHLDVCDDGTVLAALQVQREAMSHDDVVPLVLVHRLGERLRALDAGLELVAAMHDYAGSVAVDAARRVVGATSPRGNLALFWHVDTGALLGQLELFDVCGIAASPEQGAFVLTGGNAQARLVDADTLAPRADAPGPYADTLWDNHLVVLPRRRDR
jgi:hypothetical protein